MPLTRGQILAELDRRGQLPAEFKGELNAIRQNGDGDFLKSLPSDRAALVQAISEGRAPLPTGAALRSPFNQQLMADVAQFRPGFNAADAASQRAMRISATSGKIGQNLASFNTALGHMGNLARNADALNNSGVPVFNSLAAGFDSKFNGNSDYLANIRKFNISRQAVADELTRAFRQSGGNVHDVKGWEESLNAADSPKALRSAIQEGASLLQSRIDAVGEQYSQGMGTASNGLSLLNPHAQQALKAFTSDDYAKHGYAAALQAANGGNPPSPGSLPDAGGSTPPTGNGGGGLSLATGSTRTEHDQRAEALIEQLVRSGSNAEQINVALKAIGVDPGTTVNQDQVSRTQAYLKTHPNYSGFASSMRQVPNSLLSQVAATPVGTALGSFADSIIPAGAFGQGAKDNLAAMKAANPNAALVGDIAGIGAGAAVAGSAGVGLSALAGRTGGLAARVLANPLTADALYGGAYGTAADPNNRLLGATLGAVGGAGVGAGARYLAGTAPVAAASNKIAGMFGRGVTPAPSLTNAESSILGAANKADVPDIQQQLSQAASLNVPMSLADTHPELRELAGAAVRRSPTASGIAEDAFIPRARGQIDRFGQAVTRDLGPIADIPQTSADLIQQARATAAPLYDAAYAAPGASSVKLDDLAQRPSMKAGLQKAFSIAQEEGRDPTALGFKLTDQGDVSLTRVPSFQTLDYVKRGLDETLEPHRNQITRALDLNETTRAINGTKAELLKRMDVVNPDYAAARSAYAGPAQSRDAMARGQSAVNLDPNLLGVQVANQSPEQLAQMQLGYRSGLMDAANRVRYSSNPFDATLGTPAAEQRLATLHPANPGVGNLLQQRDLERGLAQSSNAILGNSKTAQRQIADQSFAENGLMGTAVDAGINMAMGQVPTGVVLKGLTSQGLKDAWQFGVGKRAVAKADQLAPVLFNTDPAAASQSLTDLLLKRDAYGRYINDASPRRLGGMFGAGIGGAFGAYLGQ